MGGFGIPGMPGPGGRGRAGRAGSTSASSGRCSPSSGRCSARRRAPASGPVNYDLAGQLARQQLAASTSSLTGAQRAAVSDAVKLAELWLDAATDFPAGATETKAWSATEWVDASLPTWKRLCDPVAQRVSGAWLEAMPEEMRTAAGPMLAMLGQMGGLAFGSQLGHGLAQLAAEVLTSTEIGIPVGPDRVAALLPENVEKFTRGPGPAGQRGHDLPGRPGGGPPPAVHPRRRGSRSGCWVRSSSTPAGIRVDSSRIEELARGIDPSNPAAIQEAMQSGMFEPETTPEQQVALARLETLLALVEGWVDAVVADAVGERLPGAGALRETLRRRRASGGPAEQTFATVVGLELRPRRLRAAAELWRLLGEQRGIAGRDALWAHPDLIPTAEDLDDPAGVRRARGAGRPDRRAGEAGRPGGRGARGTGRRRPRRGQPAAGADGLSAAADRG